MRLGSLKLKSELEKPDRKLSIRVELVTPQFGGGAEARKADANQWLRPASVRGALRFWWRALFGGTYRSIQEMYCAESEIFGGAAIGKEQSKAGKVSVIVRVSGEAALDSWAEYQRRDGKRMGIEQRTHPKVTSSALSIAYFPANENKKEQLPAAKLVSPLAWAELIIYDQSIFGPHQQRLSLKHWQQVEEAMRAYVLFGGSGSRTRRGAGAISLSSPEDAQHLGIPDTTDAIKEWLRQYLRAGQEHDCFLLSRCQEVYITPEHYDTGQQAQEALLKMWREFRQQRPHPSSWFGPNEWGRTKWPEADAIRYIADTHASWENGGHRIHHKPEDKNKGRAPRAHLGLPIVIKFKDDQSAQNKHPDHQKHGRCKTADPVTLPQFSGHPKPSSHALRYEGCSCKN